MIGGLDRHSSTVPTRKPSLRHYLCPLTATPSLPTFLFLSLSLLPLSLLLLPVFMPQRTLRRRAPAIASRRTKPPRHLSPSPRRRTPPRSSTRSKPFRILKRCSSAPLLFSESSDGDHDHNFRCGGRLFRPQTFSAAFESSPSLFASSPQSCEV